MSTSPSATGSFSPPPPPPPTPHKREITLISHSMLFYWWPIWVLGFTMALITYFEDHRLAIMPSGTVVKKLPDKKLSETETYSEYELIIVKGTETKSLTRPWSDRTSPDRLRLRFRRGSRRKRGWGRCSASSCC